MSVIQRLREVFAQHDAVLEPARKLDLATGYNVRDLGEYPLVGGGLTSWRRFVRSGSLDMLSAKDQRRLYDYGVRLVLDLRSRHELSIAQDKLAEMPGVRFRNVPLFDVDITASLPHVSGVEENYLAQSYVTMLSNRDAIREIFSFFATAEAGECVLFHCAAGMDRTGMTSMLLLGLAGVQDAPIVADYCYSFGGVAEVDRMVYADDDSVRNELLYRRDAVRIALQSVYEAYDSFEAFLGSCGIPSTTLDRVRAHLTT